MAKLANKFVHPTKFTGEYPDWNGFTFLDWDVNSKAFHPADDYNFGSGAQDLGQDVVATASGKVAHTQKGTKGYGNFIVLEHKIGYNLRRFISENYNIDTDTLYSLYAHLGKILVAKGNELEAGAKIGEVGKSGTKSPHLHFEIYQFIPGTDWSYYPINKTKEWVKQYYLPAYSFIEAVKNGIGLETFLGKTKEYWLTVENDRKSLLEQLGKYDGEKNALIDSHLDEVKRLKSEYEQSINESAKTIKKLERDVVSAQNVLEKSYTQITKLTEEKIALQNRITEVLIDNANNYKFMESVKIVVNVIKNMIKKDDNG